MMRSETRPAFDRALSWALRSPMSPAMRYFVATLLIVAVALFRAAFVTSLLPWLLFIPVVLLIALLLGKGAGIHAVVLAAILAGFSIANPGETFGLSGPQWAATAVFTLTALGVVALASELRSAFHRLNDLLAERFADHERIADRESFLSGVLGSSTDCIKVLDLDGCMTFMTDGGMKLMDVPNFAAISGRPWPAFWQGRGKAEAEAAIEAARDGRSVSFIAEAATMAGTMKWWHVAVSPILSSTGRTERILSVSRDITDSRRNEEERSRLVRVIETSSDFIGMARLDGSVFFLNDAACTLIGLDRDRLGTVKVSDFFPPEQARELNDAVFSAADRTGRWSGERLFRHFTTGELIPVLFTVFPVHDSDGSIIGYGTVTRDYRELRRAKERQQLLNNELSHRLKNVLSIVQAVAARALRQADSLPAAGIALSARLVALGRATDMLTASAWTAADLRELADQALTPHGGIGHQFRIEGPPIVVNPQVAMALALAFHELATNATKYGALSSPAGHVRLTWWITQSADGPRFNLRWEEIGGPIVQAPTRQGFGTLMIERSLKGYLRGNAALNYLPTGVVFNLDAALSDTSVPIEHSAAA